MGLPGHSQRHPLSTALTMTGFSSYQACRERVLYGPVLAIAKPEDSPTEGKSFPLSSCHNAIKLEVND